MNFFFVPFMYFYHSRLKTLTKTVSWFSIYTIPIFILAFFSDIKSLNEILYLLVYIVGIYSIYEVGYINNDCETIKNEINPTTRLSQQELDYYNENALLIYFSRCLISLVVFFVLSFYTEISFLYLAVSYLGLLCVFFIYNSVRSIANLPLHFLLVVLRFSSFSLVFNLGYEMFFLSILIFPLINLVERCGESRFSLIFFQNKFFLNRNIFRVIYYFVLTLALFFLNVHDAALYASIYMLSYRAFSPLVLSVINKG
jgi:hypothetical protein